MTSLYELELEPPKCNYYIGDSLTHNHTPLVWLESKISANKN